MKYGFLRCACVSPEMTVADTVFNAQKIIELVKEASEKKIQLLVFPELCITGYTCQDLFLQDTIIDQSVKALEKITDETKDSEVLFAVGLPVTVNNARYNCAAFCHKGEVLCLIPKTNIPNHSEFYECRWFTSSENSICEEVTLSEKLQDIPFGTDIILEDKNDSLVQIACEICEDLWVPLSPSTRHSLAGATVICNLSASNEVVGKADYRRSLVSAHSAKITGVYIYSDAGNNESTSDMVFSGHNIISENGTIAAESVLFDDCTKLLIADVDLQRIQSERLRSTTFCNCRKEFSASQLNSYRRITIELSDSIFSSSAKKIGFREEEKNITGEELFPELYRTIPLHPFIPEDSHSRNIRCREIISMLTQGLAKRLRHIHAQSAVIGLSGGLDSTLALLITVNAFKMCSLDTEKIVTVTMPCFGTTDRTYTNACLLAKTTGTNLKEISIKDSVRMHFKDIGHDENIHDVTYENCQARERTQILMDLSNKVNGIVIGTGDLSELALGWCTYNGDHMSMYVVNGSIPKTLVRYLVDYFADEDKANGEGKLCSVLKDILDTPVSPELLPPEGNSIAQKTEDIVGPYELHDFFMYYVLRWGFSPKKIYFLAVKAFEGKTGAWTDHVYTKEIILKWLKNFYRRFFTQQFKRNCMPDGAKVGTVSLSPRGDWRMPSDASAAVWLKELDEIC